MGPRLFSALLEHLQEPYEDRPMIDKLHRLGKLGYLPKLDDWQSLRVIRNRFADDDPEDDALKAAYLNEAISAVPLLLGLMAGIAPVMGSLQGT
jgi:hypothetical protein